MAEAFTWFRGLHMLFALLWGGAAIYRAHIIQSVQKADDEFRDRFYATAKHGPYMGINATLAYLFGTLALIGGNYGFEDFESVFSFFAFHGALGLATFAFIIGWSIHFPCDLKLAKLAKARIAGESHNEARYTILLRRDAIATRISGVLVMLAILGMTGFRYLA